MKKFLYIIIVLISFNSCSEYQKVLKTESIADKFKYGTELFDAGKYSKANRLFEQIIPSYRGKPQAEKLFYMHAKCLYQMKEYYSSGYQFDRFVNSYEKSEKVEEAAFLSVKSYYMLSPVYTKDQKDTVEAIEKLQLFINSYPKSVYLAEANSMVKELDFKLENKAFHIAKQYNTISDFKSSIKAFDNFLLEYPGSSLREEAYYYRLDSAFKLAINSVNYKKEIRLKAVETYINSFISSFSESKYTEEVNQMLQEVNNQLQSFNTKS